MLHTETMILKPVHNKGSMDRSKTENIFRSKPAQQQYTLSHIANQAGRPAHEQADKANLDIRKKRN